MNKIKYRSINIALVAAVMMTGATYSLESQSSAALPALDPDSGTKRVVKRFTQDVDEMWSDVSVDDDCPVSHGEVRASVDGVLIRSRIRPLSLERGGDAQILRRARQASEGLIYLDVDVDCLVREVGNPIFDIDVHLGIEHLGIPGVEDVGNHPFDSLFLRALLDENYGAFGVGDGEYILEAIEESVEDAVTVFILAHME